MAASGTGLAFPSQVTYVARDPGVDLRKREAAEAQVREWRRARTLYLPEFPKEAVAELDDTLPYPPPGAPAAKSA